MNKKLIFSVEKAEIVDNNDSSQFATAKIEAFHTGHSLHDTLCDDETLQRTAPTIYEKPLIYEWDSRFRDFGTHSENPIISGFIVPNSAEFTRRDDGRLSLNVFAKIWKRYAPQFINAFTENNTNSRSVSVEMEVKKAEDLPNGMTQLLDFAYSAVCVLGELVTPASPDANIEMLSFAKEENEKYQEAYILEFGKYEDTDIDFTIPKKIKENATKALEEFSKSGAKPNSVALSVGRYLVKNEKITPDRIRQMSKFLNRKADIDSVTFGLYGGKQSKKWLSELMTQLDEIDSKKMQYFEKEGDTIMPYTSLKDVNPAIKGIEPPVSLVQANSITAVADKIGVNKEKNGYAIAISQFKKSHVVKDGHWVAKQMSAFDERGEIEFAKDDMGKGSALKVDKSKKAMSDKPWGEVDKTALRNKVLEASNYASLVKDVYALVEAGWEDHPSSSLKYPIMQLEGDTLVYNRYGLSAALQRAEGQNESGVVSKVKGIYDKMGLDKPADGKSENMSDDDNKDEMEEMDMADDKKKPAEGSAEEEKQETPQEEKAEQEKGNGDAGDAKKKFSLDGYVDVMAALGFLKNTTDVNEEMAAKMRMGADEMEKFASNTDDDKDMDYATVMGGMYAAMCGMSAKMEKMAADNEAYMAKMAELEKFKADMEDKQKEFAVNSTLKELDEKVVIPADVMNQMREKAKNFSLETIDAWKNDCKATVFDFAVKGKTEDDGIIRYGMHNLYTDVKPVDDIWAGLVK